MSEILLEDWKCLFIVCWMYESAHYFSANHVIWFAAGIHMNKVLLLVNLCWQEVNDFC